MRVLFPFQEVPEALYPLLPFTAHCWDFVTWHVGRKKSQRVAFFHEAMNSGEK